MLIQKCFHPIVQHHFYFGAYASNYSYRSNFCALLILILVLFTSNNSYKGDDFFFKMKNHFLVPPNELSDVNKTISNEQTFELRINQVLFF